MLSWKGGTGSALSDFSALGILQERPPFPAERRH